MINTGEDKIFSKAWMYSQMTSFEDIGIVFVVLLFYVDKDPPISVYVCTRDMKLNCFRDAIKRFLFQFNIFFLRCIDLDLDPINNTSFREWHNSGYLWMDYPFRFSFLRIFVVKRHIQKDGVSLGLLNGDDLQFSELSKSTSEDTYLSEIDTRSPFPDIDDFVVIRVSCD